MIKSNFNPNKIKFLLEAKGYGRLTDEKVAQMFNVEKDTIQRWKRKSPVLFDRIEKTGILFEHLIKADNKTIVHALGLNKRNVWFWKNERPKLLTNCQYFFESTGIKFEDIYEKS